VSWNPLPRLDAINAAVWGSQPASMPAWRRRALRLARLAIVLFRDLAYGQLTLWAMSLVYTTLLSFVPLLALSFSVLKAFGVHNQIEPMLERLLAPLGASADEISPRIIEFVDHTNVGVLGSAGLALLLYTVVSLVQKIEESFNFIWHIAEPRSITERFSLYLSALLVGPILIFAAVGITAATLNIEVVREVLALEPIGWMVGSDRQAGALSCGHRHFHPDLHGRSQHPRRPRPGARRRLRRRPAVAAFRMGVCGVHRVIEQVLGDLLQLCRRHPVHVLAISQLADPAVRRKRFLLLAASGVRGRERG
jgi:hypothetical protein